MTTDVLLSTDDVLVVGPPTEITVDLDIGAKGQRGSQIFLDMGKPSEVFDGTPLPYDLFFNLNPLDSEYLTVYQYVSVPVLGGTWVKVFKIFPNELRKNYSVSFVDGVAVKTINVTDILPLSLIGSIPEPENFNIVYSIENDNPLSTTIYSIQIVPDPETEFINLVITLKAVEYVESAWTNLQGTRTVHLDIRVV